MDAELWKSLIEAGGTIIAGLIVGVFGTKIAQAYQKKKDQQDKDAQWRSHAIELTKLDLERKLKQFEKNDKLRLRPSILDFLANYRDLTDLDARATNAKALYNEIQEKRTKKLGQQQVAAEEDA